MLNWLTTRHMHGGLVFGPPGWMPERIEDTFDAPKQAVPAPTAASATSAVSPPGPATPGNRGELRALLKRMALGATSTLYPSLAAQLADLGDRALEGILLPLLPTEPESALATALERLAFDEILAGLDAIITAVPARQRLIALDRHDHAGISRWQRAARNRPAASRLTIHCLLNRYPQANPTLLLWTLRGKRLPVGALPTQAAEPRNKSTRSGEAWLIADPVTCWALGRHLRTALPFRERPVQLFVQGAEPRLVMARLGESIPDLCRRLSLAEPTPMQAIINGLMTGSQVSPEEFRIHATTESITIRQVPISESTSPCITCGWCVDVCPTRLTPVALMELANAKITPRTRAAQEAKHCIACGLCSYVCPTRLPLMEKILDLRARLAAKPEATKNAS